MKCPKCNSINLDSLKFCGECGAKLISESPVKCCHNCGKQNIPDVALYCPDCGGSFEISNIVNKGETIIDRFPEINFLPVSSFHFKNKKYKTYIIWISGLLFISSVFWNVGFILQKQNYEGQLFLQSNLISLIALSIANIMTLLSSVFFADKWSEKKLNRKIVSSVDYIECSKDVIVRFVYEGKFGIFNTESNTIIVPPQYDFIDMFKNNTAKLTKGAKNYYVDIHGNFLK